MDMNGHHCKQMMKKKILEMEIHYSNWTVKQILYQYKWYIQYTDGLKGW